MLDSLLLKFANNRVMNSETTKLTEKLLKQSDENTRLINGLFEDIRVKEQELKASEERYKNMYQLLETCLDALPGHIVGKDLDGNFILTNKRFRDEFLHGCSIEEALYKNYKDLDLDVTFRSSVNHTDEEVLKEKKELQFIIKGKVAGVDKIYQVSKAPFYENGKLKGVVGFSRDITDTCAAAFEVLDKVTDATCNCPRECGLSGEVNCLLESAVDIIKSVIANTFTPKKDKENGSH